MYIYIYIYLYIYNIYICVCVVCVCVCLCVCRDSTMKIHKHFVNLYFNTLQDLFQSKIKIRKSSYKNGKINIANISN